MRRRDVLKLLSLLPAAPSAVAGVVSVPPLPAGMNVTIPFGEGFLEYFKSMTARYVLDYGITNYHEDRECGYAYFRLRLRSLMTPEQLKTLWCVAVFEGDKPHVYRQ